ncbi:MAG: hypothetical protein HKN51_11465 [Saprospiraceae bacterium]|nr:hypothetical protein [Bacteroidia bacterium]NNE15588.1 hypothetical protein [Saprospiraceae bacterium]
MKKTKKILYIDMDNVLVDFVSGIQRCDKKTQIDFKDRLDEVPGIFGKMELLNNAIKSYKELCLHFDTYILSTSPWKNETALVDKLRWVKNHLGDVTYKRLILSHHKNLNLGDFLVDDWVNNRAGEFNGELIRFGSDRFPNWVIVKEYLLKNK